MDQSWGSGDPNEFLGDLTYMAYDDHRYLKWDTSVDASHDSYISTSCGDKRDSNSPNIVGEWSLAVPDDVEGSSDWDPSSNTEFYAKWFAAQVHSYEKQQGWVFWTWKAQLDDYRWSYQGEWLWKVSDLLIHWLTCYRCCQGGCYPQGFEQVAESLQLGLCMPLSIYS